jgi:hypothetical protein
MRMPLFVLGLDVLRAMGEVIISNSFEASGQHLSYH